jgi:hypothetical protein
LRKKSEGGCRREFKRRFLREFKRRQLSPNDFRPMLKARRLAFAAERRISLFKAWKHFVLDHFIEGVRPQRGASWRLGSRPAARFISMRYRIEKA